MKILIANPGSSSMKCQLLDMPSETRLGSVRIERIGHEAAPIEWTGQDGVSRQSEAPIPDRETAIRHIMDKLGGGADGSIDSLTEISAVGFKTVYADRVTGCQYLDDRVLAAMAEYNEVVAPLHNPVYIHSIESFREVMPDVPMVGLFENSFYDQLPDHATVYPIPWDWTVKYGIRKHLFHGASHRYVTRRLPGLIDRELNELGHIACHLGGSSSIQAFRAGVCIDGTGGFCTQFGPPLSVRAADMDSFLIAFLIHRGEGTVEEVVDRMVTEAGLTGISGIGFDFRDLFEAAETGHKRAQLAIDTFVHSVRKSIGGLMVELGKVDAITMAGGTGEASAEIRKRIFEGMEPLGVVLDHERNQACFREEMEISAQDSPIRVWVVPTDEEIIVAREVYKLLSGQKAAPNWLEEKPWASYQEAEITT